MKKVLNILKLQVPVLLLALSTTSCFLFDKEDPKPNITNEVEYNASKYKMEEGVIVDYGSFTLFGQNDTHTNYDFYVSDGDIEYDNDNVEEIEGKLAIWAELVAPDASDFKTGTFNFIDNDNDGSLNNAQKEAKYKDKFVFPSAKVYIDTNGNGILSDDTPMQTTSGTIKVSGSQPNYKIEYNLTLTNGKTVKGDFSGSFPKIINNE
jgi:hypothetical protein